jgi:hypothetical protein
MVRKKNHDGDPETVTTIMKTTTAAKRKSKTF